MPAINWTRCNADSNPTISSQWPRWGKGVEEIRVTNDSGTYRVIYLARRANAVMCRAFQKKSQATPKKEIAIAKKRFEQLLRGEK